MAVVEALALELHERVDELADAMVERIRAQTDQFEEPELREALRASCADNLERGLAALAEGEDYPKDGEIPPGAREFAVLCARLDVPLAELLRTYRTGHSLIWDHWLEAVSNDEEALVRGSRFFFTAIDRLSTVVTDIYERLLRSREQRRTQAVRDVLEGGEPAELDYDLRLHHLACVVVGPEPDRTVSAVAEATHAPHQLVLSLSSDTAWAWLGRTREFAPLPRIETPEGTSVSLGDPGQGIEGFRRSHREARDAHRVALQTGATATLYDEVALEALAGGDDSRIRRFVARELQGLDGDDSRSRKLRETLRAYFAAGQNASAAAAMLGVHDHTVGYRLRTIEERLGRPPATRRAELETALRLLDLVRDPQKGESGSVTTQERDPPGAG